MTPEVCLHSYTVSLPLLTNFPDPRYTSNSTSRYDDRYLTPSYPSSTIANVGGSRSQSTSTYTSNKSSRSSLSSGRKTRSKPKPITLNQDPDLPKDKDRYDPRTDSRYYETSYRTSSGTENRESLARKEYDNRYYAGSSYYRDRDERR